MPIKSCPLPGGAEGFQWGDHGKCYASREDAERQAEAAYSNGYTGDEALENRLAFDRASVRSTDVDGRLHVEVSAISKSNVCPYYGREIPGWQGLALDPNRIYMLWRDPAELAAGAETFNRIPILSKHIAHTSTEPVQEYVMGTTGSNARFEEPYLLNDLSIWNADAIAGIESGEQRELSSSYSYKPDMTPGDTPDGVHYDGRMTTIVGNHVALVSVGRAGADVFVGDSLPLEFFTMKKPARIAARAAVRSFLRPALAADAAPIPLKDLIKPGSTPKQIAEATKKHYGKAFDVDTAKLEDLVKRAADEAEADMEDDDAEDEEEENKKIAKDNEDPDKKPDVAKDKDEEEDDKKRGEDAAILVRRAEDNAMARFRAIRDAEDLVRPLVGSLKAMDSAEEVYRAALDAEGVEHAGVNLAGLKALVNSRLANKTNQRTTPRADDAALGGDAEFSKLYPGAHKPSRI